MPNPPQPSAALAPLERWQGEALVVGAGGIGMALLEALQQRAPGLRLHAAGRHRPDRLPEEVVWLPLDLSDDLSLGTFAARIQATAPTLRLVINTAGLLHAPALQPEKRLSQVKRQALEQSFAVNAFGPILLAQAVEPCLPRCEPCQFASLSARVGSIGDNRLGGWYAYRGAKAAQNQLLRTLALEWQRRLPLACVSLLHPGTTATAFSAPFRGSVPAEQLFTPRRAADHLLDVISGLGPEQSGNFWAWDGAAIPW
ncbi:MULTISPECIES: SDR family NAD(P)-dependent oxidoreductase [unclassified Synechococcus]|uniref:SDR family NAD(P)-dependent oxidoreductase n=1 Tax=unclassified Synechococcus TaxID=2626047 RepID=UPI0018CE6B66|nr:MULTISPECIES: SDR family NAD(P)-dependent oxidoreductase [unclassified Synechococcus]MEA5424413.1 SDR family NAD(P)-dependent oxidoreductase [Synechococcus sp. CCY9202]QPN66345.1 SDR family NAD(P)-dependent oxidoreductase [Synechococcus sp. CBW1006]